MEFPVRPHSYYKLLEHMYYLDISAEPFYLWILLSVNPNILFFKNLALWHLQFSYLLWHGMSSGHTVHTRLVWWMTLVFMSSSLPVMSHFCIYEVSVYKSWTKWRHVDEHDVVLALDCAAYSWLQSSVSPNLLHRSWKQVLSFRPSLSPFPKAHRHPSMINSHYPSSAPTR